MATGTHVPDDMEGEELLACVPHLRALAWFLTKNRDRADVLVRDAIARAANGAYQLLVEAETSLKVRMLTSLRNAHYEDVRKSCVHIHSLDDPLTYQPSVLPSEIARLEFGDFRRAFWQLADDLREALILVGASGLTYEEAAQVCGCPTSTIRSRVVRARRELLQVLEDALLADRRRDTPAPTIRIGGIVSRYA